MSRIFEAVRRTEDSYEEGCYGSPGVAGIGECPPEMTIPDTVASDMRPESRLVVESSPHSIGAEQFRLLRVRLRELWSAGKLKNLLVTSAVPQEGKSTVSLNLALGLARQGKQPAAPTVG